MYIEKVIILILILQQNQKDKQVCRNAEIRKTTQDLNHLYHEEEREGERNKNENERSNGDEHCAEPGSLLASWKITQHQYQVPVIPPAPALCHLSRHQVDCSHFVSWISGCCHNHSILRYFIWEKSGKTQTIRICQTREQGGNLSWEKQKQQILKIQK